MKKIACILIAICLALTGVLYCVGCNNESEFVDTSNAVSLNAFDDPEFAKEQEARDDALGREHIPIPDDAETITIDGEEFIPIDSFDVITTDKYDKNFILKNDIDVTGAHYIGKERYMDYPYTEKAFTGKINGNNYKLYGECGWPIFGYIKGAEICNFVLSTELHNNSLIYGVFCYLAENSSIKNIVNYAYMGGAKGDNWDVSLGGLICLIADCTVENVINYSDVTGEAAIVQYAYNSTVRNCKNYGNISVAFKYPIVGAVVSVILLERYEVPTVGSIVEDCENYGNIIGVNYIGGIVGRVELFKDAHTIGYDYPRNYFTDLGRVKLAQNPSVIRNCKNYGNIYRYKDYEEDPLKNTVICCFGGIAGLGYQIENCTNSGNIYGFEVIHPEYTVDYIGGVAGAACTVTDCTSSTKLVAANTIKHTDDICGYLIEK